MGAVTTSRASDAVSEIVDCGIGARTLASETSSGDLAVIMPFCKGVLIAAVDGLGHGSEAAVAAAATAAIMRDFAGGSLERLMRDCHAGLRKTRGAAVSVASLDAEKHTMTWLGVGNVEGRLYRATEHAGSAREHLLRRGGIVGYQMEALRAATVPLVPGDTLIFATDGVDSAFDRESPIGRLPQEFADDIVSRYGKASDDALVVVARYLGSSP